MFRWLKSWLWNRQLIAARKELVDIIEQRGGLVKLEVAPKQLLLTSYFPDKPKTASVIQRSPDGTQTIKEVTYFHSIWEGDTHFRFWPSRLHVCLTASAPRPSLAIVQYLRDLLSDTRELKGVVEQAVIRCPECEVQTPQELWKRFDQAGTLQLEDDESTAFERRLSLEFPPRSSNLESLLVELRGDEVSNVSMQ